MKVPEACDVMRRGDSHIQKKCTGSTATLSVRGRRERHAMRHANLRIKRDGLRSETAPSLSRLVQSNVEDGDDPVVAVNDDDLITNDEVHVPAPLGIDLDECRRNLYHAYAGGHRGASAEGEVDVISPWHIPAG